MRSLTLLLALFALSPSALADGDDAHGTTYSEELVGGGVASEGMGFARRFGSPASV